MEKIQDNVKSSGVIGIDMPKPLRVSPSFQHKIYKYSKKFMYSHALLSCLLALTYSVITIFCTNQWQKGIETPGWHINGGYLPNTIFANILAVAVNLNLLFAAFLVLGFYKQSRQYIWFWYIGQFFIELSVTTVLILAIIFDCKPAALMTVPVFLYYAFSLSFFRHLLASTVIRRQLNLTGTPLSTSEEQVPSTNS